MSVSNLYEEAGEVNVVFEIWTPRYISSLHKGIILCHLHAV